jgi:hypothetical protein
LQALLRPITEVLQPLTDTSPIWHGDRIRFIDGTGVSLPDMPPLQNAFGQPSNQTPGCRFPVARLLALFHAGTGLLQSLLTAPLRSHEMTRAAALHPVLRAGDVFVGDCAFGTFAHLDLLIHRGLNGVFGMSQRRGRFHPRPEAAATVEHTQADWQGAIALGPRPPEPSGEKDTALG